MWPFREKIVKKSNEVKQEKQEKQDKEWEEQAKLVKQLHAWRKIGEEFQFLGRRMIVSRHHDIKGIYPAYIYLDPGISAYYADEMGVIRLIRFNAAESAAIMRSQPNTAVV